MLKIYSCLLIFLFIACQSNNDKSSVYSEKQALYTVQDTLNLNGHKFLKKEFNSIVDNFPRLYQDDVLHPDSLYKIDSPLNRDFIDLNGQKQNISFDSDAGQDRYFALYAYFLTNKNKGTRFEFLSPYLKNSYENINTIFERLSRGGTHYIHQSSCVPAYVAYDVYFINNSERLPEFTKKTRAERWEFIYDLKQQIKDESEMAEMTYAEDGKIEDLVNKLNDEIVNDYVLYKVKKFTKPYLDDFLAAQKENGKH
jgi:uncharacterized protein YbcC (UPF0753/DUF2309 family)